MIRLDCEVQQYAWGKFGHDSAVATIKKSSSDKFSISDTQTYAELWMGTHSSGPAKVYGSDLLLSEWIKSNPNSVGLVPPGYSSDDLPFLFKVLSVNTALSIQAHPNKKLAIELHDKHPSVYKDANHKPEMAIALTEFECLCGFRAPAEIEANLIVVPELRLLIGSTASALDSHVDPREHLRGLFSAYMGCDDSLANEQINALVLRLSEKSEDSRSPLEHLLLRLNREYPNDRGIFAPCLLNVLTLQRGESFFIGADEPHAYLRGDCVECMALSDNVVRAGLTPKFKDVDTLCNMLHYRYGTPDMLIPTQVDQYTVVYRPPLESCAEFEVELTTVPVGTLDYSLSTGDYASILLVTSGRGGTFTMADKNVLLRGGDVLFAAANSSLHLTAGDEEVVFYRAHVNLSK